MPKNQSNKKSHVSSLHIELDHAITSLANHIDKIKDLLSDAALYGEDICEEIDTVRHIVDDLLNACDCTEEHDWIEEL